MSTVPSSTRPLRPSAASRGFAPAGPPQRDIDGRGTLRPAVESFHERWAKIVPGIPGYQRVGWNHTWTDQAVCRLQLFAYDQGFRQAPTRLGVRSRGGSRFQPTQCRVRYRRRRSARDLRRGTLSGDDLRGHDRPQGNGAALPLQSTLRLVRPGRRGRRRADGVGDDRRLSEPRRRSGIRSGASGSGSLERPMAPRHRAEHRRTREMAAGGSRILWPT